jgi:hypothetical protein
MQTEVKGVALRTSVPDEYKSVLSNGALQFLAEIHRKIEQP